MTLLDKDDESTPIDGWQRVSLIGGPHDGQQVIVPLDQDTFTAWQGPTCHHYYRTNDKPEMRSGAMLARMLGGAG